MRSGVPAHGSEAVVTGRVDDCQAEGQQWAREVVKSQTNDIGEDVADAMNPMFMVPLQEIERKNP